MKLKDLIGYRKAPEVNPGASDEEITRLLSQMGYGVARDQSGRITPVPLDLDAGEERNGSILNKWGKIYDGSMHRYDDRPKRVRMYDMMDGSGAEGSIVLDTYADEVVNVVDNAQKSIQIQISDKGIEAAVMEVLTTNGVFKNIHQDVRQICKYGDGAYVIEARRGKGLVRVDEAAAEGGAAIDNPLKPSDITLRWVRGPEYELLGYKNKLYKLRITKEVTGGFKFDNEELFPWEFVPFIIADRDTFPYGLSVLEKMRVPWEQLNVLEQLLAAARANSIDRIAVSVPGLGTDVTSIMAKLTQLKNSVKSILQLGQNGRMTRNQDVGITEWMWIPDSFKVQKLSTSVQLSGVEDVTYFRDKLYNASRLPKGFFVLQEGNNTQRPMSLRQQDLKFARSLIPVSEAYCEGLRQLIVLVAFYLGSDVSKLKVSVSMKKSPYISEELLENYKSVLGLVETYVSIKQAIDPTYKVQAEHIRGLLDMVDGPIDLLFPEDHEREKMAGNSAQPGSLMECCLRHYPNEANVLDK